MGKIVAIGGGENGRPGTKYETRIFYREIIRLTEKERPKFLFIGLAGTDADSYYEVMKNIYAVMYGCETDHLTLADIKDFSLSSEKISKADIIYVGGGNTLKLMTLLRKYGTDNLLRQAYAVDKVLCGVSAGGICWCRYGNSDSRILSGSSSKQIKVTGLGLVDVLFCPHYVSEASRQTSLKEMMKKTYKYPAVALENAALEIVGDKYRILKLENGAVSKKIFWKNGEYHDEDLSPNEFRELNELYLK